MKANRWMHVVLNLDEKRPMARHKRKRTAAEKHAKRERQKNFMIIFINGKQKRVLRPPMIEGLPVNEFIARNANAIWLLENELEEILPLDDPS